MTDDHKASNSLSYADREFFIARISSGYLRYIVDGIYLQIRHPVAQVRYDACEVYNEFFVRANNDGLPDDSAMLDIMRRVGLWSDDDEQKLVNLPQHMDIFKVEMFKNVYVPATLSKLREYLNVARTEYNKVLQKRHMYDYVTCAGIAHFAKWQYIIRHSTYCDNRLFDWSVSSTHSALNYYYRNMIEDKVIRELAHTQPWDSMWTASAKSSYVFNKNVVNMTPDQYHLVCWSSFYDSINESPDRPLPQVIEDDDMLDGWLILEKKKREDEHKKRFLDNKYGDIKGSDVFLPARSIEEAEAIMSLNSSYDRQKLERRFVKIKQKGTVGEHEFDDVKQELIMQANRLQREAVRGRR